MTDHPADEARAEGAGERAFEEAATAAPTGEPGSAADGAAPGEPPRKSAAGQVAAGILASRLLGFVRQALYAHFFGVGAHADVLETAFRSPNLLQNLLGEGTISAGFIPIYSRMIAEGRREEAGRFAGAVLGLLIAIAAGVALLGVLFAEPIVTVLAPGYLADRDDPGVAVDRFSLAVSCVRILFPMTGLLVLSAWALGVLNSHRRFFLAYFAPVLWNVAILATLIGVAFALIDDPTSGETVAALPPTLRTRLLFAACWGALAGGALQFAVQLPLVFREMRGFRLALSTRVEGVRAAFRATGPVVAGRGVSQVSAYLDIVLASLLAVGAVSSLRYALVLYMLPVSLFGMSVAAAELPELARMGDAERDRFGRRLAGSLRQMGFLTVPTLVGYLAFGYLVVGAIYRRGAFGAADNWLVYALLAAYALGLLATTISRLLQSSFYAVGDTKTPAKVAVARVVTSTAVAVPSMFLLDRFAVAEVFGVEGAVGTALYLGALGLALGSSVGAWLELALLQVALRRRLAAPPIPWPALARFLALAATAALPAAGLWWLVRDWPHVVLGPLVVALFAAVYLAAAQVLGWGEMEAWAGRLRGRLRR
jgi:putative peptidoglycan lipid II flippase